MLDLRGPLKPEYFSAVWSRYHERWRERNERMERIERATRGQWDILMPDDSTIEESASPNLILSALEDTAEAASLVPSLRVKPSKTTPEAKKIAEGMEKIGTSYLEGSEIELLTLKSLLNLAGYGMFSWVVIKEKGCPPRIQWRDPRLCFPESEQSMLGAVHASDRGTVVLFPSAAGSAARSTSRRACRASSSSPAPAGESRSRR